MNSHDLPCSAPTGRSDPAAFRVNITVIEGPHVGQAFTFDHHDTFLVGRSSKAHFRLPRTDEFFSRLHFMLEINPPQCRLLDMGSTNGTFVNGQRVTQADLRHGDLIKGGLTVMRVTITQEDSATPTRQWQEVVCQPPEEEARLEDLLEQWLDARDQGRSLEVAELCRDCPALYSRMAERIRQLRVVEDLKEGTFSRVPVPSQPAGSNKPGVSPDQVRSEVSPFADYEILTELGRGGMGIVYLVLHRPSGKIRTLKAIRPRGEVSQGDVQRFLREASILQDLQHPHIVPFRGLGQSGTLPFFVMDFLPGLDAARLVKEEGGLAIPRAVRLAGQLLEALQYAHERRFVHRDIKPQNLLVVPLLGQEFVQVLDFGLARMYQQSKMSGLTMMGTAGGTPGFMPPEQITSFRDASPAADQYSAAATLYFLLTGQLVHDLPRDIPGQLNMLVEKEAIPIRQRRPEIPEGLALTIHRALAREPEKRFDSAGSFRAALLEQAG